MARRTMITRTIESSKVTVLGLNTSAGQAEPETRTYEMAETYKDSAKALKAVKKAYDTPDWTIAKVTDIQTISKLYGMTEQFFLEHAEELDPKTRKTIATSDTDSDAQ